MIDERDETADAALGGLLAVDAVLTAIVETLLSRGSLTKSDVFAALSRARDALEPIRDDEKFRDILIKPLDYLGLMEAQWTERMGLPPAEHHEQP